MLDKSNYIKIGKLKKKFGKNGEFILSLRPNLNIDGLPDNNILFLDLNSAEFLPVFIEYYSDRIADDFRVKFEYPFNINIDYYLGKDVFVEQSFFSEEELSITDFDIIGWTANIPKEKLSHEIIDVINMKMQTIIVISFNEKEIMIPLHEDFIKSVNVKKKTITLNIPDGLIDLNA